MEEVRIEVELARSMLSDLPNGGGSGGDSRHIPRVPPNIRNIHNAAYDPKIISIGPYHHGKPSLKSMEDDKKKYLLECLTRMPGTFSDENNTRELKLVTLINSVRESEQELLSWYSLPPEIQRDDFVKLMVLDACFIIGFLIKIRVREERGGDHIFSVGNLLPLLRGDLLLLENQLPFFILEKLYQLIPKPNSLDPCPTLKEITFSYLTWKKSPHDPQALNDLEVYHILHLYDLILLPGAGHTSSISGSYEDVPSTLPSASKLKEAGIKLSKKKADNFLEVSYVKGEVQIPRLEIKDVTIPVFRNLIAFEQCCPSAGNHFTAYTRFMDLMVNNTKDVEFLQDCKIIENKLGSEEEVVFFLNQIFTEVIMNHQNHYLAPVFRDIDAYCATRWHRHKAKFRQDYCGSPWAGSSKRSRPPPGQRTRHQSQWQPRRQLRPLYHHYSLELPMRSQPLYQLSPLTKAMAHWLRLQQLVGGGRTRTPMEGRTRGSRMQAREVLAIAMETADQH